MLRFNFFFLCSISTILLVKCDITYENSVKDFLKNFNLKLASISNEETYAKWYKDAYYTEDEAEDKSSEAEELLSKQLVKLIKQTNDQAQQINTEQIQDSSVLDQLRNLPALGYDALNDKDKKELEEATSNMSLIYRNVHLCSYQDPLSCDYTLIPHVQDIIFESNDCDEIEYYWNEWQTKSGSISKDDFAKFIKLYRKTASLNGFDKPSDYWLRKFGRGDEIMEILDRLMEDIQPLFKQLHARVRSLLRLKYGPEVIKCNEPYPQHLSEKYIGAAFRNENHDGIELPYPEAGLPNITKAFLDQGCLPKSFFQLAENFYTSIGLKGLESEYWDKNVVPKGDPSETYLYCTNTPYNYLSTNQIQMTHCPNVDFLRYMNMFESVSSLHYYKESKIQPPLFQTEPFPDYLESLGKIFSLSATTPTFLEKNDVLPVGAFEATHRLNRLYFMGFQEIFVLPLLYVLDKYRVDVLNAGFKNWDNCAYWNLNEKYTGSIPPATRTNRDFDIPSKLLVGVDEIYTGTILGTAFKYQVYKYLCEKTGQYEKGNHNLPLDYCDLSGHPEIGENISKAMALGSSKPWPEILAALTDGQTELCLDGFLEYYEPLFEWLKEANEINDIEVGWKESKQCQK